MSYEEEDTCHMRRRIHVISHSQGTPCICTQENTLIRGGVVHPTAQALPAYVHINVNIHKYKYTLCVCVLCVCVCVCVFNCVCVCVFCVCVCGERERVFVWRDSVCVCVERDTNEHLSK